MMYFAFMHKGRYYLLPPDCPDTETLLRKYGDGSAIAVTELIEEKCLAPYFVSEHAKDTLLTLDPDRGVYPCMVELYTMSEYNERLRALIPDRCEGCPNFSSFDNTDESLKGHHEEVTLDGVCFYRAQAEDKDGDHAHINAWIRQFLDKFPGLGLEALINENKCDDAEEKFVDALASTAYSPVPPIWIGKSEDGKYFIYSTAFLQEHDSILMDVLFRLMTDKFGEKWVFKNYIPRGADIKEARAPLGVEYESNDDHLSLNVYTEPGKESAAYLWFAVRCGEPDMMRICTGYDTAAVDDEHPLPQGCRTAEQTAERIDEIALEYPAKDDIFPACKSFISLSKPMPGYADDADEITPRLIFNSTRALFYYHDLVLPIQHGCMPGDIWNTSGEGNNSIIADLHMPIVRICLREPPLDGYTLDDPSEEFRQFASGAKECLRMLSDVLLFCSFAHTVDRSAVEIFGFVFNLAAFLYAIRRLSPMFTGTDAELYLYTASRKGGGHYRIGFDMELLDTEEEMWAALME